MQLAEANFFNPFILFKVFRGLNIRKAFNPFKPLILLVLKILSKAQEIQPTTTTIKSKIFQESSI